MGFDQAASTKSSAMLVLMGASEVNCIVQLQVKSSNPTLLDFF
jgi:hypothetical protein